MQVRELGRINLAHVLVQARAVHAVALVVGQADELGGRATLHHAGPAVRNTAVGAGLGRAGRAGVGVGAELGGDAALAPDVAAGVERARVEGRDVRGAACWHRGARLLGAAHGVGQRRRHGRRTAAEAYDVTDVEQAAAVPCPRVLVVALDVVCRQVVGGGQPRASVVGHDGVRRARPVAVRLGRQVRQGARRAAHVLAGRQ